MPDTWIVIAGGGTGGHLIPGLSVAEVLVARGHPASSIHFLGSRRGIEAQLVPPAGFGLTELGGRGLPRRLGIATVRAVAEQAWATLAAGRVLRRLRPAVMLCSGGHASVAPALAAYAWRIPIVVMEQNAVPGRSNRLIARLARASAVAFPGTPLPRSVVTGNPIRSSIVAVERTPSGRATASKALGLGDGTRRVVTVSGGSLGARRLNEAVAAALPGWAGRGDLAVFHIVGTRDWSDEWADRARPAVLADRTGDAAALADAGLIYVPVPYEERTGLVLAAADLAVSRAGGAVAELAVAGVPSVLVPLPGAPGDHQTANARVLESAGAAVVVPDADFDAARLVTEVNQLLADPERLAAMGGAALSCGRPDAAAAVAELVERWARR